MNVDKYAELNAHQKLLLLDVGANPVLKEMLQDCIKEVTESLHNMNANRENFVAEYIKLQDRRRIYLAFDELLHQIIEDAQHLQET